MEPAGGGRPSRGGTWRGGLVVAGGQVDTGRANARARLPLHQPGLPVEDVCGHQASAQANEGARAAVPDTTCAAVGAAGWAAAAAGRVQGVQALAGAAPHEELVGSAVVCAAARRHAAEGGDDMVSATANEHRAAKAMKASASTP